MLQDDPWFCNGTMLSKNRYATDKKCQTTPSQEEAGAWMRRPHGEMQIHDTRARRGNAGKLGTVWLGWVSKTE